MIKDFIFLMLVLTGTALASPQQIIDTLGSSPKGQFVALEEYGYRSNTNAYYVSIRIMNVWSKEFVGTPIKVEFPAHGPDFLRKARDKAKVLAQDELRRFHISG